MKLGRLGVTIAGMLAVLCIASCSNSSGGGSPTTSTTTTTSASHSWYYTVTVTTGTQAYVSYCINSTGGQDSPGTVTAPWTSARRVGMAADGGDGEYHGEHLCRWESGGDTNGEWVRRVRIPKLYARALSESSAG